MIQLKKSMENDKKSTSTKITTSSKTPISTTKTSITSETINSTVSLPQNSTALLTTSILSTKLQADDSKPHVKIFDLNKPLEPASVYQNIPCRESARYIVTTSLCMHDISKDVHVNF
jgi:hypothetical protein